jgi:uncharacterized protein YndB with AHSA1/START domain
MTPFVDACMSAPVGASLLARLEAEQRGDVAWFEPLPDSDPDAVEAAIDMVGSISFGRLCLLVLEAAHGVGPWTGDAPGHAAAAYRHVGERRPIAGAIDARFGPQLHAGLDRARQQWWRSAPGAVDLREPLFGDFESVYGNGEFTWAGLWTATDPPDETHDELVAAWEIHPGPVVRWRLPVAETARVHEIHRPEDWAALVASHPRNAGRPHDGWELPGPNQHRDVVRSLLEVDGQRAAVVELSAHRLPDWRAAANSFDAVHLSWAGFITTEGFVATMEPGVVTMLRYWGSERTLWLADRFGEPEPLAAPAVMGSVDEIEGTDSIADQDRSASGRRLLRALLGRGEVADAQFRVVSSSRIIRAPAERVFAMIADPALQPLWDGNDNLSEAAPGQRIRAVGDVFTMTLTKGSVRENHVVEFVEGRLIAWKPAEPALPPVGHLWRWEVDPIDTERCQVTHTYDWTELTDEARFQRAIDTTPDRLAASIERLADLVESRA